MELVDAEVIDGIAIWMLETDQRGDWVYTRFLSGVEGHQSPRG